ncbi:MAG: histidine phosphatase family protein, partial [Mesorhizobium sp.]
AVCKVLGLPLGDCFRFDIDPASITTAVSGDWGSKLIRLNEAV